tara:strand:- start:2718 stop:3797 length:1080 start_codon:yes stop_codon:yes gene_type:complete
MTFFITSCDKDDDDHDDDHGHNVTAPADYTFERNGLTSVAYAGQTCRLNQASALDGAMKDASTTEAMINDMIYYGIFPTTIESCSDQKIGNKIAVGTNSNLTETEQLAVQNMFLTMVTGQAAVLAASGNTASAGVAGTTSAGSGNRMVDEKGLEFNQGIMKGLIGAMCLDQITNKYTHPEYLSGKDNTEITDNYTSMEHYWDEGFGYLYGRDNQTNPALQVDALLNKYLGKVSSQFPNHADDIYNAFKLGRAAIVAGDYDLRDEQAVIIKERLDDVVAYKASDYLKAGANEITAGSHEMALHDLSEGYGFIISLQFTDHFTHSQVNTMLDQLMEGNGFWDRTASELNAMAAEIDTEMGF